MTAGLVNRTYIAGEEQLPEYEDIDGLIDLIVSSPHSSNLNVYRNLEQTGSLRMTPRSSPDGSSMLMLSALGRIKLVGQEEQDISWRGTMELLPNREVADFELVVILRESRLKIFFQFDPEHYEFSYKVEQDGETLVDSEDSDSKAVKRIKALLFPLGLSPKAMKRKAARGQSLAPADAMRAQFGKVMIAGVRQSAYIVTLSPTKSRSLKFYFSETGEMLKVGDEDGKPVMGTYDILSEGFKFPPDGGGKKR